MKFLLYDGRHCEQLLTVHTQEAWEFLLKDTDPSVLPNGSEFGLEGDHASHFLFEPVEVYSIAAYRKV